jgi:hypothetical protein
MKVKRKDIGITEKQDGLSSEIIFPIVKVLKNRLTINWSGRGLPSYGQSGIKT